MATILIDPINIQSRGGFPVCITGIDPTDHDCIVGIVDPIGTPRMNARWNENGTMRGGTDNSNLDMSADEMVDIVGLLQKLGHSDA